jgi:hypothetical protein
MSLLSGMIGSYVEPKKIESFTYFVGNGNAAGGSLPSLGLNISNGLHLISHFANKASGSISTPPTPTNFTSLYTYNDGIDSLRISYRIYTSAVNEFNLPSLPNDITQQSQAGHIFVPASGYTFTGLSLINNSYSERSSGSQSSEFTSKKNDIALGLIWFPFVNFPSDVQAVFDSVGGTLAAATPYGSPGGAGKYAVTPALGTQVNTQSTFTWNANATAEGGLFIFRPTFSP